MTTSANFMKRYITFPHIPPFSTAPFLSEKITIPNISNFVWKLHHLKKNPSEIEFISDFDYTITKYRHENQQCDSLFGMWTRCHSLPHEFKKDLIKNYLEYDDC